MRVLLVLASTLVAGYIAWVSWNKQGTLSVVESEEGVAAETTKSSQESQKVCNVGHRGQEDFPSGMSLALALLFQGF